MMVENAFHVYIKVGISIQYSIGTLKYVSYLPRNMPFVLGSLSAEPIYILYYPHKQLCSPILPSHPAKTSPLFTHCNYMFTLAIDSFAGNGQGLDTSHYIYDQDNSVDEELRLVQLMGFDATGRTKLMVGAILTESN